jgi:sarcosine oxidase, subunit alpha
MLTGGARRLASLYGVAPGRRAVVVTTSDRGHRAALALKEQGVQIAAVADLRAQRTPCAERVASAGIEVLNGCTITAAVGRKHVQGAFITPLHSLLPGSDPVPKREFDCDLVLVSGGGAPATSLPTQAGATTRYDEARGHFVLDQLPGSISAAGQLIGEGGWNVAETSGEIAGLRAAHGLGFGDDRVQARIQELQAQLVNPAGDGAAVPPPDSGDARHGRSFSCFCEDVSAKDIHRGVEEGYDSIELCKRFTTVTMGPCQGRMCQLSAARLISRETGQQLADVGTTTARPPWSTVPMGALAGPPQEPAKRSAIHSRHRALGARIQWAGDWRRAYDYGDPTGEALAVHESAGLIDVSTLGKLLVRGPEAGAFLDLLYPNRISNLKPGRVRYGVLTSDAGRIMDDGTLGRIDEETFYVTTTSSGAGAVEQWFSWWLADWRMEVTLTDVTQALCAVNLAGPKAREILSTLTDLDVSPEAFTYLDAKQAAVAGADALILRIGFVGELGYEIHYPAAHGEHVWDAIMAAGAPYEIRPFGLEPQRVLRLQKQHIIVGQDTDSESTPYGAAMPWAVKLDKEENFIGKWALERASETPAELALVGFTLPDGRVPTEGAVVLDARGHAAGQVTSARHSRQLDRVIGMAWVPAGLADDGAQVTISDNGARYTGTVVTEPFHDPAGELLRS